MDTNRLEGLSPRANHPWSQLHLLHGSLFDIKCTNFYCDYLEKDNFTDPIVPALAIPEESSDTLPSATDKNGADASASIATALKGSQAAKKGEEADISDAAVPVPEIAVDDLPRCPECKTGMLRPGVVWFGEALPGDTMDAVDRFVHAEGAKIDLMLVIGTSAKVYPAAGYTHTARAQGARVAVFNMDEEDGQKGLTTRDWFFHGDAGVLLPDLLKPITGDISALGSSSM